MFRFFKRRKDLKRILIPFLDEADESLIMAYTTFQIKGFVKYASDDVIRFISDKLGAKESKLFGAKNYRTRTWTILSNQDDVIKVRKELRHSHVKLNKGIYVAIGDDITEVWDVKRIGDMFEIIRISEVDPNAMQGILLRT